MERSATLMQGQEEMNPHGDGRYIPILDGWRAVAIFLVLMFHGLLHVNSGGSARLQKLIDLSGRTGALGVLVFFCISGYLITQRLVAESRDTGRFSARSFYIKRVFRILPPLALYLLCIGTLALLGIIRLVPRDWSAVCFLANYLQGSWYTTHFWSLSVEEHFYLFWPFCILLFGWRRAMWIGVALIVAVAAWRPWELQHHFGAERAAYLQHTDMRLDYIMMGSVLALALRFYPSLTGLLRRLGSNLGFLLLLVLFALSTRTAVVDLRSIQAILLTLLVCSSAIADASLPRALLANPAVLWLGKISYSLYVWQQLFLAPSDNSFWSSLPALPLRYLAALVAAYLSFQLVERPFIRYGRTLLRR